MLTFYHHTPSITFVLEKVHLSYRLKFSVLSLVFVRVVSILQISVHHLSYLRITKGSGLCQKVKIKEPQEQFPYFSYYEHVATSFYFNIKLFNIWHATCNLIKIKRSYQNGYCVFTCTYRKNNGISIFEILF